MPNPVDAAAPWGGFKASGWGARDWARTPSTPTPRSRASGCTTATERQPLGRAHVERVNRPACPLPVRHPAECVRRAERAGERARLTPTCEPTQVNWRPRRHGLQHGARPGQRWFRIAPATDCPARSNRTSAARHGRPTRRGRRQRRLVQVEVDEGQGFVMGSVRGPQPALDPTAQQSPHHRQRSVAQSQVVDPHPPRQLGDAGQVGQRRRGDSLVSGCNGLAVELLAGDVRRAHQGRRAARTPPARSPRASASSTGGTRRTRWPRQVAECRPVVWATPASPQTRRPRATLSSAVDAA